MTTVSWLVSQCHVGQDHNSVRRYVLSRFNAGRVGFLALPKLKRRGILAEISREHKANRATYAFVMKGGKRP